MNIENIIFIIIFLLSTLLFIKNLKRIIRNIKLGKSIDRSDNPKMRLKNMIRVALGQSKMVVRPIAGILHIIVAGFIIINIEVLEIIIDGVFGTHRVFSFLGGFYNFLIGSFEVLAILVLLSVIIYLTRRNIIKIKRFYNSEMKGWPTLDANLILVFEIFLMSAFLLMNTSDLILQNRGFYEAAGYFPISSLIAPFFTDFSTEFLIFLERFSWWFHIIGIFAFLNYLVISKHLHILFAFPNTYYANLNPKGQLNNLDSVTKEIKIMMDPNNDPYSNNEVNTVPERFGAKDINDLNWVQILNAYTCTNVVDVHKCPANITGKSFSK